MGANDSLITAVIRNPYSYHIERNTFKESLLNWYRSQNSDLWAISLPASPSFNVVQRKLDKHLEDPLHYC